MISVIIFVFGTLVGSACAQYVTIKNLKEGKKPRLFGDKLVWED